MGQEEKIKIAKLLEYVGDLPIGGHLYQDSIEILSVGSLGEQLARSGVYSKTGEILREKGLDLVVYSIDEPNSKLWEFVPNITSRKLVSEDELARLLQSERVISHNSTARSDIVADLEEKLADYNLTMPNDNTTRPFIDVSQTKAYLLPEQINGIVIAPFLEGTSEGINLEAITSLYRQIESQGYRVSIVGSDQDFEFFKESVNNPQDYFFHAGRDFEWLCHLVANSKAVVGADNGISTLASIFSKKQIVGFNGNLEGSENDYDYNPNFTSFSGDLADLTSSELASLTSDFLEKEKIKPFSRILYINDTEDFMVCRWRTQWPTKHLQDWGYELRVKGIIDEGILHARPESAFETLSEDIKWADIVVFQRTLVHGQYLIDKTRELGKVVGYDIDDLVFKWDPVEAHTPVCHHEFVNTQKPVYEKMLSSTDFVITATPSLQEDAQDYCSRTYILRNALDLDELDIVVKPKEDYQTNEKIRIGWVGGPSHYEDLLNKKELYKRIHERYNDKVTFVFKAGVDEFANLLREECPGIDIETYGFTPEHQWKQYYKDIADLNLDIMVSPLIAGRFNEAKSELKFLESSLYGVPMVSSNVGGVCDAIVHGQNGYLVEDIDGFVKYTSKLIESVTERERIGRNARKTVEEKYNIYKSAEKLDAVLKSVTSDMLLPELVH